MINKFKILLVFNLIINQKLYCFDLCSNNNVLLIIFDMLMKNNLVAILQINFIIN